MVIRVIFALFAIILAASVLSIFLLALLPILANQILDLYALFPQRPSPQYTAFLTASGTIVAAVSVIAAITTFVYSTRIARRAQRKQHTITVLLEQRFSAEFQSIVEKRRYKFPEYTDVTFDEWNAARTAQPKDPRQPKDVKDAAAQRDSALALTQLLNYYEFLAVGITEGDLDEAMLYKTLRSIMCNLVDDSRYLIAGMQKIKPSTYEHLTALYADWRKHDARDINNNPNERPIPQIP